MKNVLTIFLALGLAAAASAQPTAFTYQGRLKNGAALAAGIHDFRFTLFNAATGGAAIGSPQCVDNLLVSEGVFTATIDFGQQFASGAVFLQIEVRADTGLTCGNLSGFVTLGPRQPITPSPVASHANAAFSLDAADGSPQQAVFVDNAGKVGIGTTTPQANLDVRTAGQGVRIQGASAGVNNTAYLTFADGAGTDLGYIGDGSNGDSSMYVTSYANDVYLYTAVGAALTAKSSGNIGIGTTTPASALHVNGQSLWLTGGNGGGLPPSAGGGLRLYDDGSRANIFAWNYLSNSPRNLALQEPGGNVGIGTTSPLAKLDVRGDIRLGSSGQLRATAGEENLRLLRGNIDGNGTIDAGSGFTCQRLNEGIYRITFLTPFSGVPTVTATAVWPFLGPLRTAVINSVSTTQVTIHTVFQDLAGPGTTDSDWSFCVIGTR